MNLKTDRRRPRTLRLLSAGLAVVSSTLLLTACGSSAAPSAVSTGLSPGGGQSLAGTPGSTATGPLAGVSPMPSMSMSAPAAGAPAAPVSGDKVAIKGFAFGPAALVVKVGTTVTWTNQDTDAHTVTSQGSGGPLNSPALATGQSFSYRFTTPGTFAYLCTIHPFMTATVKVIK